MKSITLIVIAILTFGTCSLNAQKHKDGFAYKEGERLRYVVSYRAKLIKDAEMGEVEIAVSKDVVNDVPTIKVKAYARVIGAFRWFFKLDDYYTSWFDCRTGLPVKSEANLREGGWRFDSWYTYDWSGMKSHNRLRNPKWDADRHKEVDLVRGAMDGVSLFYTLRSSDLTTYRVNEERVLNLLLDDTVKQIKYKYFGPETITVKDIGEVKTLKFSCQLITSQGSFEDGTEFFLWISDDPNRVPIYVESPIKVGSIRVRLIGCENLKYPQQSVFREKLKHAG